MWRATIARRSRWRWARERPAPRARCDVSSTGRVRARNEPAWKPASARCNGVAGPLPARAPAPQVGAAMGPGRAAGEAAAAAGGLTLEDDGCGHRLLPHAHEALDGREGGE